MLVEVEVKFLI